MKNSGCPCGTRCFLAPSARVTPHSVGRCRASDRGVRARRAPPAGGGGESFISTRSLTFYSAVFVSAINSPGIRQSDDSPTMMNTVRDSQLMLPPSSHPTALNPQMP